MANEFSIFPSNLDDGELCLPSDIFLNEVPSKFKPLFHHHHYRHLPFSCMDDLSSGFAALSLPKHHQKLPNATNLEVGSYVEARAGVLQRQQNRLSQNRDLPFQVNGFNNYKFALGGALVRESGGTGVFHPRIVNVTFDSKRKQSLRNKQSQEIQVSREMNSVKRVGVGKQEDCYYHLPPETGFPRVWT